jgi:hypothetical protein
MRSLVAWYDFQSSIIQVVSKIKGTCEFEICSYDLGSKFLKANVNVQVNGRQNTTRDQFGDALADQIVQGYKDGAEINNAQSKSPTSQQH